MFDYAPIKHPIPDPDYSDLFGPVKMPVDPVTQQRQMAMKAAAGAAPQDQSQQPQQPSVPKPTSPLANIGGSLGATGLHDLFTGSSGGGSSASAAAVPQQIGTNLDGSAMMDTLSPSLWGTVGPGLGAGAVAAYFAPSVQQHVPGLLGLSKDRNKSDSAIKTGLMSNPVTAWTVPLLDKFGIELGGHMDPDQRRRNVLRHALKDQGYLDSNYDLTLPDGATLNLGLDGGAKPYNVDFSNPLAAQGIGWLQPLSHLLSAGDRKLASDTAGQMFNEIAKGTNDVNQLRDRVLQLYHHFKLTPSQLTAALENLKTKGILSDGELASMGSAIQSLRPGGGPQKISKPPTSGVMGTPVPKAPVVRPSPIAPMAGKIAQLVRNQGPIARGLSYGR